MAGNSNQGYAGSAIGMNAAQTGQNYQSVAIGYQAAQAAQGTASVAIGYQAGQTAQGVRCIAIGDQAGNGSQGTASICMGYGAQDTFGGSLCINTTSGYVYSAAANRTYITCVGSTALSSAVSYNTSTNELSYVVSSKEYKDNIKNLDISRDTSVIYKIVPVSYKCKISGIDSVSCIAEEIFELDPYLVNMKDGKPLNLRDQDIFYYTLLELQKLRKEFDEFKINHIHIQ